jgi:hypothetical protein
MEINYLQLPPGTILRMRSRMGNVLKVRVVQQQTHPLELSEPFLGAATRVEVLEAPQPYPGRVSMIVGALPSGVVYRDEFTVVEHKTTVLAPGAIVVLGTGWLEVAEVEIVEA